MGLRHIDPETPKTQARVAGRGDRKWQLIAILFFLAATWTTSFAGFLNPDLTQSLALIPRSGEQWWGVLSLVLVHADFAHLLANSAPLAVLLFLLVLRNIQSFFGLWLLSMLLAGLFLWLVGRSGLHVGASGLVFALFGVHLANGVFNRTLLDVVVAAVVGVAYWGMLAGLLPNQPGVSWEGHLTGLIAGVLSSWVLRRRQQAQSI